MTGTTSDERQSKVTADTNNPADIEIDVDVAALQKRYDEERRKRLRPDAVAQYQKLAGNFADFDTDPHADPNFTREPIVEDIDVLIIGGGFAGAARRRASARGRASRASASSRRAPTSAAPGTGTAIPAPPATSKPTSTCRMLEELGYVPSEKYAKAPGDLRALPEVRRSITAFIARALFQTLVKKLRWDEARRAGSSAPTATTRSPRASSCRAPA